jgi:hypothetical protein
MNVTWAAYLNPLTAGPVGDEYEIWGSLCVLACFPKVGLCDMHHVCISHSLSIFECLNESYETWYAYHGNWAHLNGVLHKSFPSVCVSVCVSLLSLQGNCSVKCILPFGARKRLGKHVSAAANTSNNRRIVGRVIFYVIRVLPKKSVGLSVYPPIVAS